jgi:hypothetical protein
MINSAIIKFNNVCIGRSSTQDRNSFPLDADVEVETQVEMDIPKSIASQQTLQVVASFASAKA